VLAVNTDTAALEPIKTDLEVSGIDEEAEGVERIDWI
jgi:hypothetical protein